MNSIKLTDDMEIQGYGEYRVTHKSYSLYVVGNTMCILVDNSKDNKELLNKPKSK